MARAEFQKGQKVWVECVGLWSVVEKVQPVWANGFTEPVKVTYDVGLGRDFAANELTPVESEANEPMVDNWRLMRATNKWQSPDEVAHHPFPGTYPVVVTDKADWGGWRVPGAEYDRDPARMEFQARLIVAAPDLMALAVQLVEAVGDQPHDAPPETLDLAQKAKRILTTISETAINVPKSVSNGTHSRAA